MKALLLRRITDLKENLTPLELADIPEPKVSIRGLLVKVSVCGICHTELDEIEGRTAPSQWPMILGHQVIGTVSKKGMNVKQFKIGERVGVAWIYSSCGRCEFCRIGNENLCRNFKATGRDANGGYAEFMAVDERFAFKIPKIFSDAQAAPLLCAGAIGYRSLKLAQLKNGQSLGLTGFGASAHIVMKLIRFQYPKTKVFVFARGANERTFAEELGAAWTGDTEERSPVLLDAVIDTTPVWKPVVEALANLKAGGRLIVNAIRKEETDKNYLMKMDYPLHWWLEKEIKSVANVTRNDVAGFLKIAAKIPMRPEVQEFKLEEANRALIELKQGKIRGAKVLRIHED